VRLDDTNKGTCLSATTERDANMRLHSVRRLLVAATALPFALSIASTAAASGYWNVPSSFCQCMGFGWGAGYHAPFVLGPITCDRWCAHNEVRLPYAPVSSYSCYGHCSDRCCNFSEASRLNKTIEQRAHPAPPAPPSPQAEATQPLFDAPVEP
jgi:hypothetical protein